MLSKKSTPTIGEVKWFGGINKQTGRKNSYGFISSSGEDVYFHRSDSLSPPESLVPGAKVLFVYSEGQKGKPVAVSVQTLSLLPDAAIVDLLQNSEIFSPEDVLTLLLSRNTLSPFEDYALQALNTLKATSSAPAILKQFRRKISPASPKDPLFPYALRTVKTQVCKHHYSAFREKLHQLFSSLTTANTSLEAKAVYPELDERDNKLAKLWAGRDDNQALLAKMLSARAAERAVNKFYEGVGSSVDDVSIRQLDGEDDKWKTHDLLVDSLVSVDVKNARRPVNGKQFYVEHTVPKFKLDRRREHVRIAGLLSPYLQLEFIQNPSKANFVIENLIFLGETKRDSIDRIAAMFNSPTFEIGKTYERTVPHWIFSYPENWYRAFNKDLDLFVSECDWPDEEEWEYVLDDSEKTEAIPALCIAGKPLPGSISSKLHDWQRDFYTRMQSLLKGVPELPVIFLEVLTDFLGRLKASSSDFSPNGYLPMLFTKKAMSPNIYYPLGVIDPLGLVHELIKTLAILWDNRYKTNIDNLSSFRFTSLGLLQGKEKGAIEWKTVLAYCGGTAYGTDEAGNVLVDEDGKPISTKGKCGNTPLVIGEHSTCPTCNKLICNKCGFCSLKCQEQKFSEMGKAAKAAAEAKKTEKPNNRYDGYRSAVRNTPQWEEIPLEAYESDLRRY